MSWKLYETNGGLTLTLGGPNLDVALATALRDELVRLIDDGRPLTIDLGQVKFVDSSGLGALAAAASRAASQSGALRLTGVSSRLAHALARVPSLPSLWSLSPIVMRSPRIA